MSLNFFYPHVTLASFVLLCIRNWNRWTKDFYPWFQAGKFFLKVRSLVTLLLNRKTSEHFCTVPTVTSWCWSRWQFNQGDKGIWGVSEEMGKLETMWDLELGVQHLNQYPTWQLKKLKIAEVKKTTFFSPLPVAGVRPRSTEVSCLLEVWAMSKKGFEACNIRAVSPTTCNISHLATLSFIQHFNNLVTWSQDPSAPFHRLIQGWMFWVIWHNQHTLAPHAPYCSEGVDWWGRWPQMLATHISQLPPALPRVFSLESVVFPILRQFFERFCQSVFSWIPLLFITGMSRWAVNNLQHSYLFIHFVLETTWVLHVVCCSSCHKHVLKSCCFSFQWWLHLTAAEENLSGNTPKLLWWQNINFTFHSWT